MKPLSPVSAAERRMFTASSPGTTVRAKRVFVSLLDENPCNEGTPEGQTVGRISLVAFSRAISESNSPGGVTPVDL